MTDAAEITTFDGSEPPRGESPYLPGHGPTTELSIVASGDAHNSLKQAVIRQIYGRAFSVLGLT